LRRGRRRRRRRRRSGRSGRRRNPVVAPRSRCGGQPDDDGQCTEADAVGVARAFGHSRSER
jgi:hypothetical protein